MKNHALLYYFGFLAKIRANVEIDLLRRKTNYYASKPSINVQQMGGAALHEELNALCTVIFFSQIKMSMMSLPWISPAYDSMFIQLIGYQRLT